MTNPRTCLVCSAALPAAAGRPSTPGRPRSFCSGACRQRASVTGVRAARRELVTAEDPANCRVCLAELRRRSEREHRQGRPRIYCSDVCKDRGRRLGWIHARADAHEKAGRKDVARRVRATAALRLGAWRAA